MKIRCGRYEITSTIWIPELVISSRVLNVDIDFTSRFPWGWCAGIWLGKPGRWGFHWAWNAWLGEPNRLNVHLGDVQVDFSCFTWWKFQETGIRQGRIGEREVPVHEGRYARCFPYPEDGWKLVRISKPHRGLRSGGFCYPELVECTCPHVIVGGTVYPATSWSDMCAEHGVGTDFFRALKVKPFGYADERDTTREEWLAWKGSQD